MRRETKTSKKEKPVKVVVDTNVLVSGLFAEEGTIAELIESFVMGKFILVTSDEILAELYSSLNKPSIIKHFKPSRNDIAGYIEGIREDALITAGTYPVNRIKKDPDDNKFLSCAVEVSADYIVSGDKHLKEVKRFRGIPIVSPREFVEIINGI